MTNKFGISKQSVSAVVIRKDGTREDLGVIAMVEFKKYNIFRRFVRWLIR